MSRTRLALLSAGGTGGHLFPAEALAVVLKRGGWRIALATDHRAGGLTEKFPADEVVEIPAATPSVRSPLVVARAALTLARGTLIARSALKRLKPNIVVGFGGYPTVPPVIAASLARIPAILHEQNGVMGRANRFLARRVSALATGFPEPRGIPQGAPPVRHTGNPIRPAVVEAAGTPFEAPEEGGVLRLLVFGGSQGARVMSEIVPEALLRLSPEQRARIVVTQQARGEDLARVVAAYGGGGIAATVQPFFPDLPARIAASHLVIARSGASTVAELAAIGRPSILVPLPGALDQDQAANAASLAAIGAAEVIAQPAFTPERLAAELAARLADPSRLTEAAKAAKSAGIVDAAERLAAFLEEIAKV